MLDTMLTVEEVAAILKVKPLTVRQMFREKRLRGFKMGKSWRTTLPILEEDVLCMSRGTTPPPLKQEGAETAAAPAKRRGRKPKVREEAVAREAAAVMDAPVDDDSIPATDPETGPAPDSVAEETDETAPAGGGRKARKTPDVPEDQQLLF